MAARYDFTINKGETFSRKLTYKDSTGALVNLTGYTATLVIKDVITLTEASGISLGGTAGTIDISIAAATTDSFGFTTAPYTLELKSGTTEKQLLKGTAVLSA